MRIVRQIGLLLVVVGALSAVATSSAVAGQPLFLFHGTGGRLLGSADTPQKLEALGNVVECQKLEITQGTVTPLRFSAILARAAYSECTLNGVVAATVHPVHYIIKANGLVTLASDAIVLIPGAACTLTLPAAKNTSLGNAVLFDNSAPGLLLLVHATGIFVKGSGAGCEAEESNAKDTGTIRVTADGGLLKWHPNA